MANHRRRKVRIPDQRHRFVATGTAEYLLGGRTHRFGELATVSFDEPTKEKAEREARMYYSRQWRHERSSGDKLLKMHIYIRTKEEFEREQS